MFSLRLSSSNIQRALPLRFLHLVEEELCKNRPAEGPQKCHLTIENQDPPSTISLGFRALGTFSWSCRAIVVGT